MSMPRVLLTNFIKVNQRKQLESKIMQIIVKNRISTKESFFF